MDTLRFSRFKKRHAGLSFFQESEKIRTITEAEADYLDKGLDKHTVILFYAPWVAGSIAAMQQWKLIPELLADTDIQVAAVNCARDTLCQQYGINNQMMPSIQIWALNESNVDIYDKPIDGQYRADDLAHWLKANILGRALVHDINKENFEKKVLQDTAPWMVVFCSQRYQICALTRKQFNRMAYIVKPFGVKLGYAMCKETQEGEGAAFGWYLDEWCEGDMGVQSIGSMGWNFPFVKVYRRGSEKKNGENVNLNVRESKIEGEGDQRRVHEQVLEIMEKVMIMAAPDEASLSSSEEGDGPNFDFDDEDDEL
jgi:hypothetical protein